MASVPKTDGDHELLAARLKTLLPEEYQDTYENVQPVSMGSAGLKYDAKGRVVWDEIWQTFCHLAMAGGPPHRGKLLEPATKAEIDLHEQQYEAVAAELCRGIGMVTGLAADRSAFPGWLAVDCPNRGMAGWLARAITMENVSAHVDGLTLYLPAGPHFRVEKEIKNVVTSIAKTFHYWAGHTSVAQHRAIAELFVVMESESPLLQPPFSRRNTRTALFEQTRNRIATQIQLRTGLQAPGRSYHGWLGIECRTIRAALWMMRILVASNTLARREETLLYVPIDPSADRNGKTILGLVTRAHRVALAQDVL